MNMGRRLEEMHPVREEIVRPGNGGSETWWLVGCAAATLLVCALAMGSRGSRAQAPALHSWQINAFSDLRADEQGTYSALYTAAMEIDDMHQSGDGGWLSVSEMEEDYMPPFVRDAAWERQGRLNWRRIVLPAGNRDVALYMGVPQKKQISGSFLLVFQHTHANGASHAAPSTHPSHEIWYSRSPEPGLPASVSDQALITAGWQEVIPLKGADEIRRTKGENFS